MFFVEPKTAATLPWARGRQAPDAGPLSLRKRLARRKRAQQSLRQHLSQPMERFVWRVLWFVVGAVALDVLAQHQFAQSSPWAELAVHAAILVPVLAWGGFYFTQQTLRYERALLRRDARLWFQSERDPLTRAFSRTSLATRIDEHARVAADGKATLLVLDLHDFQRINDACGHKVGDGVLREVCDRLRKVLAQWPVPVGQRALVARVGADEFAFWVPQLADDAQAQQLGEKALAAIEAPVLVGGQTLQMRACVGYVIDAVKRRRGIDWLTQCNTALQLAKRRGTGAVVPFALSQRDDMVRRHQVQEALRADLTQGVGLQLYFQPVLSVDDGRLWGCEALLRWHHPTLGDVSPVEFIPVAEGCDLIHPLGRWVLEKAIAQLAQWRRTGGAGLTPGFKMSVNISRSQLRDPTLPATIEAALLAHGIEPDALELEITETLPLDEEETLEALQRLRQLGLMLALDDFGTGYSSLSVLLKLPFQTVKIDKQFVHGIDAVAHRRALLEGVIRTAELMGMAITAEGIERSEDARVLAELGCHRIQGWLVGRPTGPHAFALDWLREPDRGQAPRAASAALKPVTHPSLISGAVHV